MLTTGTGAMTAAEASRVQALKWLGCVACLMRGYPGREPDAHHLTDAGRRRGHDCTVALCPWHHRGVGADGYSGEFMEMAYGPSFATSPVAFRQEFGTDDELLAFQNTKLERMAAIERVG